MTIDGWAARRHQIPEGDPLPPEDRRIEEDWNANLQTLCHERAGLAHRLDLLYRASARKLRRRVRAQVGSSDEASDLVQEAFSRLLGAGSAKAVHNPAAFLNRIIRNLLIDRARRASSMPLHLAFEPDSDAVAAPNQGDALEYEQMKQRYRAVVATLPPRMREVFVLHRIEELSYLDIAARLDISVRTVEWHIAEAIVRIAKGLDAQ